MLIMNAVRYLTFFDSKDLVTRFAKRDQPQIVYNWTIMNNTILQSVHFYGNISFPT
jgi:hypothetical protein